MAELIIIFIARSYFVSILGRYDILTFIISVFQFTWICVVLPALFRVCSVVNWMNDVLWLCFSRPLHLWDFMFLQCRWFTGYIFGCRYFRIFLNVAVPEVWILASPCEGLISRHSGTLEFTIFVRTTFILGRCYTRSMNSCFVSILWMPLCLKYELLT